VEKTVPISPKLNFTPNTLGCYGLIYKYTFLWNRVKRVNLVVKCGVISQRIGAGSERWMELVVDLRREHN